MQAAGCRFVAGVDEAGRGCLAGPVVASAVILSLNAHPPWLLQVRDSKLLTVAKRKYLFSHIAETAVAVGTGIVNNSVIDSIGIAAASRLAMAKAVAGLNPSADGLLTDHFHLPEVALPQKNITHGDVLCNSIACASIIAKVIRDGIMLELDDRYPGYGLSRHKGYGTREHRNAIETMGLSPLHRRSFCHFQYRLRQAENE